MYLIPEGYTGWVFVFFGQSSGVSPSTEASPFTSIDQAEEPAVRRRIHRASQSRVYEIPQDGILRTTAGKVWGKSVMPGWYNAEKERFFYVDAQGARIELTEVIEYRNYSPSLPDSVPAVYGSSTGGTPGEEQALRAFFVGSMREYHAAEPADSVLTRLNLPMDTAEGRRMPGFDS
ncbi:MAG: hypothetical protein AAF624_03920 [Bacteroidota bacterium]